MLKSGLIKYEGEAAKWFKETFRTHSAKEYSEFINRGTDNSGRDSLNAVYPWVYARVLFACFVLFCVFAFVTDFTYEVMSGVELPVLILTGAMLVNAPVTVLLYELYPGRDLSFIKLLLVFVIGAAAADVLINIGYYFVSADNVWLDVLWTAFLEEISKALPAIFAIIILKSGNPLQCFIIGAAVGAGMSVAEDMSYIYFGSVNYEISVSSAISTSLLRALTSVSSHILWTGLVAWAFGKFRKPLINIRFWGVFIGSMALHYIWDFPLPDFSVFTFVAAFAGGFVVFVLLVRDERSKLIFAFRGAREDTEYISDGINERALPSAVPSERQFNFCNITAAICAVIISVCGLIFCFAGKSGGYEELHFYSAEEFISYVQCGEEFAPELDRPYDKQGKNYSVYIVDGLWAEATQRERYGDRDYYFTYSFEGGTYLKDISVEVDGEKYSCSKFGDGIYFYNVNPEALRCYYDESNSEFTVDTFKPVEYNFVADVVLGGIAGAAFTAGLIAFICGLIMGHRKQRQTKEGIPSNEETTL